MSKINKLEVVLNRLDSAAEIIYKLMLDNKTSVITPEECIARLVEDNIYKYYSKEKADYFRRDLRFARDNKELNRFANILIEQESPGKSWEISIRNIKGYDFK